MLHRVELNSAQATLVGMIAPVCWGMSVGLVRGLSERLGSTAGVALMSLIGAVFLSLFIGIPKLSSFPRRYLIFGVGCAVLTEFCFMLSLAISDGGRQTIEVGMVNYLWPCLTVVFAILFNGQKARWWIVPGVAITLWGIVTVLSGDAGFDPAEMLQHMRQNPASYACALAGAVAWAAYCSFTRAISGGKNPVVLIFLLNGVIYLVLYLCGFGERLTWNPSGLTYCLLTALVMSSAYAFWTIGAIRGNLVVLGITSYFTPVLSCVFASFWLSAPLSIHFWNGVGLVVAGSLVCWSATHRAAAA